MEAQSQVDEMQTISHQHAGGEVFEATNLDAARGMCPVLGKMSLEEAGLLLELGAMGREKLAGQQEAKHDEPVPEKIEEADSQAKEIVISTKSVAGMVVHEARIDADIAAIERPQSFEAAISEVITRPEEPDLLVVAQLQHAEATRIAVENTDFPKNSDALAAEKIEPSFEQDTGSGTERLQPHVTIEIVEAPLSHIDPQEVDAQAFVVSEPTAHQSDESRPAQAVDELFMAEPETVDAETAVTTIPDVPQTEKVESEPVLLETTSLVVNESVPQLLEIKLPPADEPAVRNSLFNATINLPPTVRSEEITLEEQVDQEVLPFTLETTQPTEETPREFISLETRPPVPIPELPAPLIEIERTMDQLLEVVEKEESEESGKVVAILKTIIAMPAKVELTDDNKEELLEENLEALFVELFEEADIQYTPEIVKAFVKLTKMHYLEELLEIPAESAEETPGLPDEIGTREFLQKIQHGLSAMKQAVTDIYELGRSILRLYSSHTKIAAQAIS